MSVKQVIDEIAKITEQLIEIQETIEQRESAKTDYGIVTIFLGFIPVFLLLISYFQDNPKATSEYFFTVAFFVFFTSVSFIWAVIQIAKAKTPFTYGLTFLLPLFIVFLPLLWSVLVTFNAISVSPVFESLALVVISIYAVAFFAYFVIEFLYRKFILRT